jgi:hypothetical protein
MSGLGPLTRFAWEFRYPGETGLPTVEMADENDEPPVIVTAYRTSKIEKYWSAE